MSPDEAEAFEKSMAGNEELRSRFEEHSLAWKLIDGRLKDKAEQNFREKLGDIMKDDFNDVRKTSGKWIWRLLPVAAAVVLVLLILTQDREGSRLFRQYYQPSEDALLSAMLAETRGQAGEMQFLYREGQFGACLESGLARWKENGTDRQTMLLTLLSSLETCREEEILLLLEGRDYNPFEPADRSLLWYHALALVKTGNPETATPMLDKLLTHKGPYDKAAHKLTRRLKK